MKIKIRSILITTFFLCSCIIVACGQNDSGSQTAIVATQVPQTPTARPTSIPTHTPTPQHTPSYLRKTHGPTILGTSVSNFFGKYGFASSTQDHGYTWFVDKDDNPYEAISTSIHPDGTVYRVDIINSTTTNWSPAQSTQECSAFLPTGSSFEQQVDNQITLYTSPVGEIQLWRENQEGDCILQIRDTIGTEN